MGCGTGCAQRCIALSYPPRHAGFSLVHKGLLFGLFPGCRGAHSPVREWGGSGGRSRRSLRANLKLVGIVIVPKISFLNPNSNAKRELVLELDLKLELKLDPDPELGLELELDL